MADKTYYWKIAGILLTAYAPAILAQEPSSPIEELSLVTITARRQRDIEFNDTSTAAQTSLEHPDLLISGKRDVANVLQALPGVYVSSPTRSQPSRLTLRGTTQGLGTVTIDGIPFFNNIATYTNLAPFAAENLERSEVIRGPSAYRYGNPALGGLIRLFTRDSDDTNAFLRFEGGSFGTVQTTAGGSLAGKLGRANVTVSHDDLFDGTHAAIPQPGASERDRFHSTLATARYVATPRSDISLDGTLVYGHSYGDLDSSRRLASGIITALDDPQAFVRNEFWLTQQTATYALHPQWTTALQLGFTQQAIAAQLNTVPFEYTGQLFLANWRNQHIVWREKPSGNHLSLTWGGEAREETGEGFSRLGRVQDQRTTLAGFADLEGQWGLWNALAGIRVNHDNDFGTHPNYYFGLGWQPVPQLKLRGSAGVGYRPPSLLEQRIPLLGNARLQAERAVTGEVGFDWTPLPALRLSLTGFHSRYDNLVVFAPLGNVLAPTNIAAARIEGLELEWRYLLDAGTTLGMDYTYMPTQNRTTGSDLPRQTPHFGRVFGEWKFRDLPLTLYLEGIYRGRQYDDINATALVGNAFRINTQLSYQVTPRVMLYVRGENLTDNRTSPAPGNSFPGAAVYGGMKVTMF